MFPGVCRRTHAAATVVAKRGNSSIFFTVTDDVTVSTATVCLVFDAMVLAAKLFSVACDTAGTACDIAGATKASAGGSLGTDANDAGTADEDMAAGIVVTCGLDLFDITSVDVNGIPG